MEIPASEFKAMIPGIDEGGSVLYIGAKVERMEMAHVFSELGYEVDALEVWPNHYFRLVKWNIENGLFRHILLADVRAIIQLGLRKYDVIVWWHGPEHIRKEELADTLAGLLGLARRFVILAFPWGEYPHGMIDGNPYEEHKCTLWPADFPDWNIKAQPSVGQQWAQVIAWKEIKK